jgi:AraC family transcriptional regulator
MQMVQVENLLRPEVEPGKSVTRTLHIEVVERVIQMMKEQIHESLTLEDMADTACLSPFYFNRIFHQVVGIPPCEFLATLRLQAAKRLLLTTSLSVTDICFEVGYIGLGSFTTRFTQQVGVSPRQLRNLSRNTQLLLPAVDEREPLHLPTFHGLKGRIHTEDPFNGPIFVGLFPKPIPQGTPLRCTMLLAPGSFCLNSVPDGRYYLLTAAFPFFIEPQNYLLAPEGVLVGIQGPLTVYKGMASEPIDILLRPPCLTDPPIITAVPFI